MYANKNNFSNPDAVGNKIYIFRKIHMRMRAFAKKEKISQSSEHHDGFRGTLLSLSLDTVILYLSYFFTVNMSESSCGMDSDQQQ